MTWFPIPLFHSEPLPRVLSSSPSQIDALTYILSLFTGSLLRTLLACSLLVRCCSSSHTIKRVTLTFLPGLEVIRLPSSLTTSVRSVAHDLQFWTFRQDCHQLTSLLAPPKELGAKLRVFSFLLPLHSHTSSFIPRRPSNTLASHFISPHQNSEPHQLHCSHSLPWPQPGPC